MPLAASAARPQSAPDPGLMREINSIKAIDNHAHPALFSAAGTNPEFDLPDSIPEMAPPVRLRPSNPEFIQAWRELFGYKYNDRTSAHVAELRAAKARTQKEKGDAYGAWILDKLGIDVMLSNRFAMDAGLKPPRFRWVSYANPLLFPLNNEHLKSNPQRAEDFTTDEKWLRKFLQDAGLSQLPPTLDDYVAKVIARTLQQNKRDGAVAVKVYAAYMRSLDFQQVPAEVAARVYTDFVRGGSPPDADYKALQDYLFRQVAIEAGRDGLAVHIHTGLGAGGWFYSSGASPFLLDPMLNDPVLRKTNFVLIHGGLPFAAATGVLISKPNVYADFSSQGFLSTPRALSAVIRSWLEFRPEKVLFGTDGYPFTKDLGWEEIAWLSARTGRQALALALTEMMSDGEISRARASELARMVLRDNARRLYGMAP